MPSFAQPPADLLVTDGYISLEEAFHVLGQHTYEDWDRDLALRHDGKEKTDSPTRDMIEFAKIAAEVNDGIKLDDEQAQAALHPGMLTERAEEVRQHNLWVARYYEILRSLLQYFRKRKPLSAFVLTRKGAVRPVNPDSWNGVFAMKALSTGGVYLRDGYLAEAPTARQRQAALTQGTRLAEYGLLILEESDLKKCISPERPTRRELEREAEKVFEAFFDELVAKNKNNWIKPEVYLEEFAHIHPEHKEILTGRGHERARKKVLNNHDAKDWSSGGRRKGT